MTSSISTPNPQTPHSSDEPATALPTRRERLRVLMRLRSQRQMLIGALGITLAAGFTVFALGIGGSPAPDKVRLGTGLASVETMPVSGLAEQGRSLGSGEASYYGVGDSFAGKRTASGEVFDPQRLTAAHRTLPMGSKVRVTNPANGESVVVRINDRGPFHGNRVIDLSYAAAREIGLISAGRGEVRLALLT